MELLTPEEIVRLTPQERLALIAQLWDSLENEQLPLTSAQHAELEHRLLSLDEDRSNGVTWATLKAEHKRLCLWCIRLFSLKPRAWICIENYNVTHWVASSFEISVGTTTPAHPHTSAPTGLWPS